MRAAERTSKESRNPERSVLTVGESGCTWDASVESLEEVRFTGEDGSERQATVDFCTSEPSIAAAACQ